jgi:uncharacterized protein YdeI (YjbR/CyaY-like superfamily)
MKKHDGIRTYNPANRAEWRKWLASNKSTEPVWLVLYRKGTRKHNLTYADAVEEALCFGWIDNRANPRDGESSYLRFAPRREKSNWSKLNVERSERLIRDGLMTEAGQVFIDIAKESGAWFASNEADTIPPDLQKMFNKNKKALKNFQAFAPFAKRMIIQWVVDAKRPETRAARVGKTVALAAKNIRARP